MIFIKLAHLFPTIENRQGFKIACIEEIAFNNKWINKFQIKNSIKFYGKCRLLGISKKPNKMKILNTKFNGLKIIEGIKHDDSRGYFRETFSREII